MKAYVLHGINDLRYEEVEIPKIRESEVLIKVKSVGICGSDIPRIYKTGTYNYPLIPGHEFSGEVVEIGGNCSSEWKGKRVGVFPLIPCKECIPCSKEKYELCRCYNYLGSRRNGGLAEYVTVPQDNLIEIPENVSFEQAAMSEPMGVAVHAICGANICESDTVIVCGLGTIGMFILMFLIEKGIKNILVMGNKEFQRENVLNMGISKNNYCDITKENADKWIMEHTNGNGSDVFFECVGKNETYIQAVKNTAPCGKIMLVGNPYSDMSLDRNVYWKLLRNQITVIGSWNSSFTHKENDDWHYVYKRLAGEKINPEKFISHKFKFEDVEKGLHIMRDKTEDYIKVMIFF